MERVEGLMRDLQLSEAEQKGLKIVWKEGGQKEDASCKALGKVLSEKPVFAEGLENSLGRVWCPLKGINCKGMGDNIFLFTFLQSSGKKKALEEGPWMVNNNDLIVMTEFDPTKTQEEHVFDNIPIWIRAMKLPLGMMDRFTGELIGNQVGEFMGVDVGDDDMAVGKYLRIQVRLNLKSTLMRGTMLTVGKDEKQIWCPFEYEYLPEFCFTCGIIGHEARECSIKLHKGEKQQFGRWLRAYIPKRTSTSEKARWDGGRRYGSNKGYGFGGGERRSGISDSLSWRKDQDGHHLWNNRAQQSDAAPETGEADPLKKQTTLTEEGPQKQPHFLALEGEKVDGLSDVVDGKVQSTKNACSGFDKGAGLGGKEGGVEQVTPLHEDSISHLQHVLELYEDCSGQTLNVEKTSIMFSKNTKERDKRRMMNQMGVSRESWNERYLGLPVYVGQSKMKTFAYLKDRIWQRIQGWKEKLLSRAGKEILIKACAQAIPTFAMSVFDLTKGYKDLHTFNLAMLAKQGWRMLNDPSSLCARVLKAKYFPDTDILHAEEKAGMSYTWRSILKGIDLLRQGIIKRVGDGTTIKIWSDPWVPRKWSRTPITPRGNALVEHVSDLIDPVEGGWDEQLVESIFWKQDAALILTIPLKEDMEDTWAWFGDPRGRFSVRIAYKLCRDINHAWSGETGTSNNQNSFKWQAIWQAPCPLNVQQLLWRIAHNSLPVKRNLAYRGMEVDTICPVCKRFDEDGAHLFLKCKPIKKIWQELKLEDLRIKWSEFSDPKDFIEAVLQCESSRKTMCIALVWNWWTTRNKVNAESKTVQPEQVTIQIRKSSNEYLEFFTKQIPEKVVVLQQWKAPPLDIQKINIDGSFTTESRSGGWGFIIRDSDGDTVCSGAGRVLHAQDALQTEAEACIQAMNVAQQCGMTNVIIETDA
uniref:Uncharacterized protein n=1 Tax=Avena sativa TaxID=4498 RepID=A0ACD5X3E3_AVESA